ncbi:prephenate dehydrogenase dimerization domain-containing protein [Actinoplanes sp. NPDC051851]|uniref:prephenate dehydrogenase dimerization domain-containing protein n=1 Tax=Actinoplanes sp. NPDC051851 TaxID=3154753 RepID=UPI00343668E4
MGARVVPATAAEHDTAVARISHVPHLLAAALTLSAEDPLAISLAAGSFRDGTRVAATRPELTAAMCAGNWSSVHRELDALIGDLRQMADALTSADPVTALMPILTLASTQRRSWPPAPGTSESITADVPALLALGRSGGWVTSVDETGLSTMRPEPDR